MRLTRKHRSKGRLLWISSLSIALGLLSLPAWSQDKSGRVNRDLTKTEEFKELRERADAIQIALNSPEPGIMMQAEADRLELIKDLEKWAKKYKVQVSQMNDIRPLQIKDGKVVISNRCDQVVEAMGNVCFAHYGFFDHSAYQCIYRCVPQDQTVVKTENQPHFATSGSASRTNRDGTSTLMQSRDPKAKRRPR